MAAMWTPDKLKRMSDQEILDKFCSLQIPMTKEQFLQDISDQEDIDPVLDRWQQRYAYRIRGFDEDFPRLAIRELWRRWAPDHFGAFMIDDLMGKMVESESDEPKMPQFERIWTALKEKVILPYGIRSFDELRDRFDWFYDVESVFFDFEGDFVAECRANRDNRDGSFASLITIYEDILRTLPESDLHNLLNIRRSIAEAHFFSGNHEKGEVLFRTLTEEHPTWVWGYVGWGDVYTNLYSLPELCNKEKAEEIYRRGLRFCDQMDREILEERLNDL
ncbi:hypothetical protein EFBL_1716 [Effusibacillus lacus]|uniref:Tetratricopeptide repeat protein n=1 Tax=Effusibacillus lacus TaxID=1348429 RepID=A0A292YNQ0_9BACL|nr:hypothetical protein EFBL_1716 [Effusibacillus lacus]